MQFLWATAPCANLHGAFPGLLQQMELCPASRLMIPRMEGFEIPAFGCTKGRNGTLLCPSSAQAGASTVACCTENFQNFFVHSFHPTDDVISAIGDIERKCDCEGALLIGFGVHQLLTPRLADSSSQVPWSYPFGRRNGWLSFREKMYKSGKLDMVVVSPTHLDEYVMMLHPPKPDWREFAQFSTMEIWDTLDAKVAEEMGVKFVSLYSITRAFKGLQCDGMHFGSSYDRMDWDCHGFTVVSDVAMQHVFHELCTQ